MAVLPAGSPAITLLAVGDPGVGNEWTLTVPDNTRFRIVGVTYLFTTDSTAANRFPKLLWKRAATVMGFVHTTDAHVAFLADAYCWLAGFPNQTASGGLDRTLPLPTPLWLLAGDTIGSLTEQIQSGDKYAVIRITVEEQIQL